MTSLLLERELSSSVGRCLIEAIPGASISEIEVVTDRPTILILSINQILAAFAFGRDDASYEALYSGFKKHFLSRQGQWAAMDVSFVYCLPPTSPPTESFCSRVETDVYFCRKFVVALSTDIASSLSRLPFFPLSRLSGAPLRPPSAQTLLQRSNVRADLARFLVAPGARGAQSILTDCVENRLGDPAALSVTVALNEHKHDEHRNPATLESLTIQNFRAYRMKKTFTFGSSITVLYGPNGFGKTSFFDALDFAVTGGIGRLPATGTDHALVKAAKHLDCGDEKSIVSLTFKRGEVTHSVIRDLADPKQATLDSKRGAARKDVLTMLTGGEAPAADRVENFVSLFRATHLFSQERQELTNDFHLKSELPSDLVSRMLAFEDYVSGIKKTSEVQGLLDAVISRANKEIIQLEQLAEKDRQELRRLEGLAAANANPGAIDTELMLLKQDVLALGIELESSVLDAGTLRGWRAQLESRLADSSSLGQRLSEAMGDLQKGRTLSLELATVNSTITDRELSLTGADQGRASAEESHRAAIGELTRAKTAEAVAQKAFDSLTWVAAMRTEYQRLVAEREQLNATLVATGQHDVKLRAEEDATESTRLAAEVSANNLREQVMACSTRLRTLQSLTRQEIQTNAASARLRELVDADRASVVTSSQLRAKLAQASAMQQPVRIQVARLESEVANSERASTEVKSLLAQLRGHVNDGTCLLCGVDHGSKDALLAKIDALLNQDGKVTDARARLAEKRAELTRLADEEAAHQVGLDDGVARQDALRTERERLERLLSEFSLAAASLGIAVSAEFSWPRDQIHSAARQEEHALAALTRESQAAVQGKAVANKASDEAKAERANNTAAMQATRAALERTGQAIQRLVSDARRGGTSFDIELHHLQTAIGSAAAHLQSAKEATVAAQSLSDQKKVEAGRKAQELSAIKKALEDAQRRRASITEIISGINASLGQLGLSAESADQSAADLMTANSELLAQIGNLRNRSMNLEVALDAAATAAAFDSLRTRLNQNQSLIEAAKQERARHEPWVKYFESISKLLSAQQSSATDQFTRGYGPRTAIIQRRLRPVYGFGDVSVSSRGGAIRVDVMRNGAELRPIDYFSQSQVQTLVLGLFLTACSSQTWSAFSAVMMDDPVTHFDDLNTYALLDLISGLLQSSDGARQFVISTCDEKLLQLARQKFRHLKDGAKFYRFSEIGAEGPLVSEMPV